MAIAISPGDAAEHRTGQRVEIEADELIDDDLYVVADHLVIRGRISGDLLACANWIEIEGEVGGNAEICADRMSVKGSIGRSMRACIRRLDLDSARIGKDAFFVCDAVTARQCDIRGDVAGSCRCCRWDADVGGKFAITAEAIRIGGEFEQDVDIVLNRSSMPRMDWFEFNMNEDDGPVANELRLGESTNMLGDLRYRSAKRAVIEDGARVHGQIDFEQVGEQPWDQDPRWSPGWWLARLRQALAILIAGGVFAFLCPRLTRRVTNNMKRRPIASILLAIPGMIAAILAIVLTAAVTLAVVVLCLSIGFAELTPFVWGTGTLGTLGLAITFGLFVRYVSIALFAVMTGQIVLGRFSEDYAHARFLPLLVGVFLLFFLALVPNAEWVLFPLSIILATGGLTVYVWSRDEPPSPPPE